MFIEARISSLEFYNNSGKGLFNSKYSDLEPGFYEVIEDDESISYVEIDSEQKIIWFNNYNEACDAYNKKEIDNMWMRNMEAMDRHYDECEGI